MQSSIESDGSEEYFDAEDSTPHRLVKCVTVELFYLLLSNILKTKKKKN